MRGIRGLVLIFSSLALVVPLTARTGDDEPEAGASTTSDTTTKFVVRETFPSPRKVPIPSRQAMARASGAMPGNDGAKPLPASPGHYPPLP